MVNVSMLMLIFYKTSRVLSYVLTQYLVQYLYSSPCFSKNTEQRTRKKIPRVLRRRQIDGKTLLFSKHSTVHHNIISYSRHIRAFIPYTHTKPKPPSNGWMTPPYNFFYSSLSCIFSSSRIQN